MKQSVFFFILSLKKKKAETLSFHQKEKDSPRESEPNAAKIKK